MGGQYFDQPTIATYTHTQATAANVWIITHNLNAIAPSVEIWINNSLVHADVTIIDSNSISVSFNIPAVGSAFISTGR